MQPLFHCALKGSHVLAASKMFACEVLGDDVHVCTNPSTILMGKLGILSETTVSLRKFAFVQPCERTVANFVVRGIIEVLRAV